jgi:hypothetical protein
MYSWMLASVLIMGILYWWLLCEWYIYRRTEISISLYMRALEKRKESVRPFFIEYKHIVYTRTSNQHDCYSRQMNYS